MGTGLAAATQASGPRRSRGTAGLGTRRRRHGPRARVGVRRAGLRDRRRRRRRPGSSWPSPQHRGCWRSPRATARGLSAVDEAFRAHITYSEYLSSPRAPRESGALSLSGPIARQLAQRRCGASSSPRGAPIRSQVRDPASACPACCRRSSACGCPCVRARGAGAARRAPARVRRQDRRPAGASAQQRPDRAGRQAGPAPRVAAAGDPDRRPHAGGPRRAPAPPEPAAGNITLFKGSGNWGISYQVGSDATSSPTSRSTGAPARWSKPGRASRPTG